MDFALPEAGQLLADNCLDNGLTSSCDAGCDTAHMKTVFGMYANKCLRHRLNTRLSIRLYGGSVTRLEVL